MVGETVAGVTSFAAPLLLKQGGGSVLAVDGRTIFSDTSSTVQDPEDPNTFWTFLQWEPSDDHWAMQITELRLVPEPRTALLLVVGLAAIAMRAREARSPGDC